MILNNFSNLVRKVISVFKLRIILDSNEKKFIKKNIEVWSKDKVVNSKKVILIDLFYWYPLINFWSIIVNVISNKFNAKIEYFYTDFYQSKASIHSFFISKLHKIYSSFNSEKGISEYDFKISKKENLKYSKMYKKLKIDNLVNFKRGNIIIGDLIYDTYLRITPNYTIKGKDKKLKKIFFRANKIFDELQKYFQKNQVICVIPGHTYYINYGIITRIAIKRKIPVIKISYKNRANQLFHLMRVEKNGSEEYPYYNYKKIFNSFPNKKKKLALKIGKNLIEHRLSGKFDNTLPYMPTSSFNKVKKNNNILKSTKQKIFLFPHCYLDAPHRYRWMVFDDFYKQMKFFLNQSKKLKNYQFYYKPHPNELKWSRQVHNLILKNYPSVIRLKRNFSHQSVVKSKPALIITNHGTIAHEFAACKVPVLNTGDNPHINYKFCLHTKNKNEILNVLNNLNAETKKINYNLNDLYEYMYMRYRHFVYLNNEHKYLRDSHFAYKNIAINKTSKSLNKSTLLSNKDRDKIKTYVLNFIEKNL